MYLYRKQRKTPVHPSPDVSDDEIEDECVYIYIFCIPLVSICLYVLLIRVDEEDDNESWVFYYLLFSFVSNTNNVFSVESSKKKKKFDLRVPGTRKVEKR